MRKILSVELKENVRTLSYNVLIGLLVCILITLVLFAAINIIMFSYRTGMELGNKFKQ